MRNAKCVVRNGGGAHKIYIAPQYTFYILKTKTLNLRKW